nr:hypothetical protein [Anaerobium acetethylicum]
MEKSKESRRVGACRPKGMMAGLKEGMSHGRKESGQERMGRKRIERSKEVNRSREIILQKPKPDFFVGQKKGMPGIEG